MRVRIGDPSVECPQGGLPRFEDLRSYAELARESLRQRVIRGEGCVDVAQAVPLEVLAHREVAKDGATVPFGLMEGRVHHGDEHRECLARFIGQGRFEGIGHVPRARFQLQVIEPIERSGEEQAAVERR